MAQLSRAASERAVADILRECESGAGADQSGGETS